MTKQPVPLHIHDISDFAKRLRQSLLDAATPPSHLAFMGHVARAAGFDNFQHLRATPTPAAPTDKKTRDRLARAARVFDEHGRMGHWPANTAIQGLCLWVIWSRIPARVDMTERAINDILKSGHAFGDHVLLRRSLIDHRLATRTMDGAIYRRVEQIPPPEALSLISRFSELI